MRIARMVVIATLLVLVGIVVDRVFVSPSAAYAAPVIGPRLNVVVLCPSCAIPGDNLSHVVVLDQNTGRIWAYYRDYRQTPVSLGTITTLGEATK
jgi:hypothetical protein